MKNRIDRKFREDFLSNRIPEKVCKQSKAVVWTSSFPREAVVVLGIKPIASMEIDTCQSADGRELLSVNGETRVIQWHLQISQQDFHCATTPRKLCPL